MIEKHPSEAELQEFALDPGKSGQKIAPHIRLCQSCQAEIENYKQLFTGMKDQEKPVFDFALADLVLAQIKPTAKSLPFDKLLVYLISLVAFLFTGTVFYIFRKSFSELFAGVAQLFLYLIITTAISILFFQLIDIYRVYQKKWRVLEFY